MAEIMVTRKAYVRKDGTPVKAATYYAKDRVLPARRLNLKSGTSMALKWIGTRKCRNRPGDQMLFLRMAVMNWQPPVLCRLYLM